MLEFDRGSDRPVYFLAEPYPICSKGHVLRPAKPIGGGYPAKGDQLDWAATLAPYHASLAGYYFSCSQPDPYLASILFLPERTSARQVAHAVLGSESARPDFTGPLVAGVNLYAFHATGTPELVGYLSVEAGSLEPASETGLKAIDLDVLFSVGDPVSEQVASLDTTITYAPPTPISRDATVHFAIATRAPAASDPRVTIAVNNRLDRSQGQVLATTRYIPTFDGRLLVSNVVVGETRSGPLRRGSHQLTPLPGHAVHEGTPFRVYYEVYGNRQEDPLSVSMTIVPARDPSILARLQALIRERRGVAVEFREPAILESDGVMRVQRDVSAELAPGSYALIVTVLNQRTQESVTVDSNLIVTGAR